MPQSVRIRPIQQRDFEAWQPLWDGYNAFYGRSEVTALPPEVTEATWQRFFDSAEPVFALVAESQAKLVGLVHYLFHRSTTSLELTCYLQDLFTAPAERGRGMRLAVSCTTRWRRTPASSCTARTSKEGRYGGTAVDEAAVRR